MQFSGCDTSDHQGDSGFPEYILKEADLNGDKFITEGEAEKLYYDATKYAAKELNLSECW